MTPLPARHQDLAAHLGECAAAERAQEQAGHHGRRKSHRGGVGSTKAGEA